MITLLKQLCQLNGTSGDENAVADFITANIPTTGAVIRRDNLGNVLVFKKGKKTPEKLVMLTAHMDEVGFIVTSVNDDGYLRFALVGGVTPAVVYGRKVMFEVNAKRNNRVYGVIASKPVHMLSGAEKDKQPKSEDLYIDIGAATRAEAEAVVSAGDYAYFAEGVGEFGKNHLRGKAIDNRLGCAILLDLLKGVPAYDTVYSFTVQEEIGCRGASAAAFNLEPEICIVLEATTACDIAEVSGKDKVCALGGGPVISYRDKVTVYDRELYDVATAVAKENKLKFQTKTKVIGGNDASVIHKTAGGVRTLALSAPCRYLHSPNCVVDVDDIEHMWLLADMLSARFSTL